MMRQMASPSYANADAYYGGGGKKHGSLARGMVNVENFIDSHNNFL